MSHGGICIYHHVNDKIHVVTQLISIKARPSQYYGTIVSAVGDILCFAECKRPNGASLSLEHSIFHQIPV